jgi:hypothetical protein
MIGNEPDRQGTNKRFVLSGMSTDAAGIFEGMDGLPARQ